MRLSHFLLATFFAAHLFANPIQDENRNAGTDHWRLAHTSINHEIEGYASATSVNIGESINLFVSTSDPTYSIEIFRMGWYGGAGGRRMTNAVERTGVMQTIPAPDSVTGIIVCHWSNPYTLSIPTTWLSGVYLAKLTGKASGNQNHILFVVRDDDRPSAILFQSSVTTMQAYNEWGGKSLYGFNSSGAQAVKVSFDRPYSSSNGPNEFLYRYEYDMVRFLEREGYDVTYQTNIDTHERGDLLLRHRAFLSVGHDEYWSWQMRENVERARDSGTNLGFFAGNVCYWQIRLEDNDRTIVAYKESALSADPILFDGNAVNDYLATTNFRATPVNRPEEQFVGVMTSIVTVDGDVVVENTGHWIYAGSGLHDGDHLKGLGGHEVDKMFSAYPSNTVRLAHSLFTSQVDGHTDYGDMTIYRAASGAYVFAVGTMQWAWGVDDFNAAAHPDRVSAAAQQITRNVLNMFVGGAGTSRRRAARH